MLFEVATVACIPKIPVFENEPQFTGTKLSLCNSSSNSNGNAHILQGLSHASSQHLLDARQCDRACHCSLAPAPQNSHQEVTIFMVLIPNSHMAVLVCISTNIPKCFLPDLHSQLCF